MLDPGQESRRWGGTILAKLEVKTGLGSDRGAGYARHPKEALMATKRARAGCPKLISLAVASCFATGSALAAAPVLPTGASGMVGIAGINTINNTMNVTTNLDRALVNWATFSIGSGGTVNFQQLSSSSAILNRVIGANGVIPQSVIDGIMSSNGRVFLINPSGIVFGAGAQIDAAGLVAS